MPTFSLLFIIMLLLATATQLYLAFRQIKKVGRHRVGVPEAFSASISLEEHQKAADYTLTKVRFGTLEIIYGALLMVLWTLGGALDLLDNLWRSLQLDSLLTGIGFILSVFLAIGLLELPFTLYRTFAIEQRFGFNNTTPGLFVSDLVKQLLVTLLIGTPLIALVLWLMASAGPLWWLYVWMVWIAFTLVMLWAYPAIIAPLFNKFSPLEDQELVERIEKLLERCGFSSNGIFVMDGSRRSSHGNAYFSGLGSNKRIVFYDTLLKGLDGDEIEAVLAHELGHFRRRHIRKRLILMAITTLVGLALLGWLMQQAWFYNGLGITRPSVYTALILFMLVSPVFTFFTQPLLARSSRKHEFEADDFAAEQTDARHLIEALVTMYKDNASTLTPDEWYSAFHDSHPPAPVRIAHLSSTISQ